MVRPELHHEARKLWVGTYDNRKFRSTVMPYLSSGCDIPAMYGHVKCVLEHQGFQTDPLVDNKSCYNPDELFRKLAKYIPGPKTRIDTDAFRAAVGKARAVFGAPQGVELTPMTLEQVSQVVKLDKSAGAPTFAKKRDALPLEVKRAERIKERKCKAPPCIAFHRIQHGEDGPKVRLVWGFPLSVTLLEGRFAYPLIETFLERKTPMPIGENKLSIGTRTLPIRNRDFVYGMDFSGFDASVSPLLIHIAFQIIATWFDRVWDEDLAFIEHYFVHTPIAFHDGNLYLKHTGVPSGSWFTQLVDSIVNFIVIQYAMKKVTGKLIGPNHILVLGDDSIIGLDHKLKLNEMKAACADLGMKLNDSKTSVSSDHQNVHFLGHVWTRGLAHREPQDLVKRMIYPEAQELQRVSALTRISEFQPDAIEAYAIYKDAFVHELNASVSNVTALARPLDTGRDHGYSKFIREEYGSIKHSQLTWLYLAVLM